MKSVIGSVTAADVSHASQRRQPLVFSPCQLRKRLRWCVRAEWIGHPGKKKAQAKPCLWCLDDVMEVSTTLQKCSCCDPHFRFFTFVFNSQTGSRELWAVSGDFPFQSDTYLRGSPLFYWMCLHHWSVFIAFSAIIQEYLFHHLWCECLLVCVVFCDINLKNHQVSFCWSKKTPKKRAVWTCLLVTIAILALIALFWSTTDEY